MKKLTQAVFDLPECGVDALSAHVESDGRAFANTVTMDYLEPHEDEWLIIGMPKGVGVVTQYYLGSGYDTTNWQQSAIDRGEK